MSATATAKQVLSRLKAGVVVGFYLLTFLIGGLFLFVGGRFGFAVDLTASGFYIAVTVLFYEVTKDNRLQPR